MFTLHGWTSSRDLNKDWWRKAGNERRKKAQLELNPRPRNVISHSYYTISYNFPLRSAVRQSHYTFEFSMTAFKPIFRMAKKVIGQLDADASKAVYSKLVNAFIKYWLLKVCEPIILVSENMTKIKNNFFQMNVPFSSSMRFYTWV